MNELLEGLRTDQITKMVRTFEAEYTNTKNSMDDRVKAAEHVRRITNDIAAEQLVDRGMADNASTANKLIKQIGDLGKGE